MNRACEIKLETIIRRKIEFLNSSKMYSDEEMNNYKSGELKAYDMIMLEINRLDEKRFEEKPKMKKEGKILHFKTDTDKVN